MKRFIAFFSAAFVFSISQVSAYTGFSPSKEDVSRITKNLDGFWTRNAATEIRKGAEVRSFCDFALNAASVGYRQDRIETALDAVRANVFTSDKKSNKYGNIYWYHGDTALPDMNGVEFCTQRNALTWILYRDRLSVKAREALSGILSLSAEGILRHNVKISYTNIILMKIWNLIALGDYFDKPELSSQGSALLGEWIRYTRENGITEYLSPTYYAIGLENLSLLCNFAKSEDVRRKARAGLDYFWTDISLNWYAPSLRLGGAHSRDYDRLTGHGDIDRFVLRAGWVDECPAFGVPGVFPFYSFVLPPESANRYRKGPFPRFVTQRWGGDAGNYAVNYTGRNFSIASSGANYYNMDKAPLVISLGSGDDTPVINYFMDGRSDYFGKDRILEGSGHMKSLHLRPFISSVQNRNEVLFLASADRGEKIVTNCESIFTFPADGEYIVDGDKPLRGKEESLWTPEPAPDGTSTLIDDADDESLKVRITDRSSEAGIGLRKRFPAKPGSKYEIRASAEGGSHSLYLNFYDRSGQLIGGEHSFSAPSKAKASVETFAAIAPDGASTVVAWIYSSRAAKSEFRIGSVELLEYSKNGKKMILQDEYPRISAKKIETVLSAGQTVFVRRGTAAAAVRIIKAVKSDGGEADAITLSNDGLAYGALSLRLNHSAAAGVSGGIIAVYAVAEENIVSSADYEAFRKRVLKITASCIILNNTADVDAVGMNGKLHISADLKARKVVSLTGASPETGKTTLSVNGEDVGRRLLDPWK
jgi:hypothetical protein